jgi:putative addiction module component (TIGR02574 family)
MATSAQILESEALSLSKEERTRLIVHLLDSIDERPNVDPQRIEQAWLKEANRRYESYLDGGEQTISSEDVFADLRADDR